MVVCVWDHRHCRPALEWLDQLVFEITSGGAFCNPRRFRQGRLLVLTEGDGFAGPARRWVLLMMWASVGSLWWWLFKTKAYAPQVAGTRQQPRWVQRLSWLGGNMLAPVRTPQPHLALNGQAAARFQSVMRS